MLSYIRIVIRAQEVSRTRWTQNLHTRQASGSLTCLYCNVINESIVGSKEKPTYYILTQIIYQSRKICYFLETNNNYKLTQSYKMFP